MSSKQHKLNRGQILATAVEASGLKKEEAAKKAGYTRSAYYKHIENPDLDFSILIAYGKALRHDFTEEIPGMPGYLMEELSEIYGDPGNMEEARQLIAKLKNKCLELLEKYNRLIEEKWNEERGKK
ncbi:MAG: helix-turn-helix domain-containing protein [Sphingobacteriales bacterium]|nr:helix-turn-helix domain-containing protein [Sphingobacteriales bacterium]